MIARRFEDLRSWQLARAFKLAVYQLIVVPPLSNDERLVGQLREAARSAVSHVSEGFGRFDPLDFARFVKMARASLVECKNHLVDAVDSGLISETTREEHSNKADAALAELGGLLDYLQSPEAKRNAERIRQTRFERRRRRNRPSDSERRVGMRRLIGRRRGIPPALVEEHAAGHQSAPDSGHQQEDAGHREHSENHIDGDVARGGRLLGEIDDDGLLLEEGEHHSLGDEFSLLDWPADSY
jgi:four helix bundle protein